MLLQESPEVRGRMLAREALVLRKYATFHQMLPASSAAPGEADATIVWRPYVKVAATGKTTVSFDLPWRETTYRAIVEAHGSGRLGAAETVIVSKSTE